MADPIADTAPADPGADSSSLTDIATSQGLLLQQLSALGKTVSKMGGITLPVTNGGTGLDHSDAGGLLVGTADNGPYSILDDVATGNALLSGGVGASPSWGKITPGHFSGVLPVANGGTNLSSLTAHAVLLGEGASLAFASPGAAGQFLQSNGSSSDPSFQTFVDGIGGPIPFPLAGSIRFWLASPFAFTITRTTTRCASGTCTAAWNISGTTIPGGSNSVSTTQQAITRSSGNAVAVGQYVELVISSVSSCQSMSFMLAITRP